MPRIRKQQLERVSYAKEISMILAVVIIVVIAVAAYAALGPLGAPSA